MPADRDRLRLSFDEDALLYDRARPSYPPELLDDLVELAGLGSGARILEVGAGTGQLTAPLAERGCEIVAVELGGALAAVARRKLGRFPRVSVVLSSFEDWPLPPEPFDAVVSATAFHWIDPAIRVVKSAEALRPGGALATIGTDHVAGGDRTFFEEVQECYVRWDPDTPSAITVPEAAAVPLEGEEIERTGRFGPVTFRRHEWDVAYSTAQYIDVLRTYSGHRALETARREPLLACIAELIESRHGGLITKRYLATLRVAQRLDRAAQAFS